MKTQPLRSIAAPIMKTACVMCIIVSLRYAEASDDNILSIEKNMGNPHGSELTPSSNSASGEAQNRENMEQPARANPPAPGFAGLLSGLLGSMTHTASTSDCPGMCIHSLASLMCDQVLPDVKCPTSSMRCCLERKRKPLKKVQKKKRKEVTTTTTIAPEEIDDESEISEDSSDDYDYIEDDQATSGSDDKYTKTCPGVCVASRLANYCEAIFEVEGLCSSGIKCCVSKKLFQSSDVPGFIVDSPKPNEPQVVKKKIRRTTTLRPAQKPARRKPTENRNGDCSGSCVSGFFALLCDEIDRNVACPGGGRCCINKRIANSGSGTKKRQKPRPSKKKKCAGICLPSAMSEYCSAPSSIILTSNDCDKGTLCCDTSDKQGDSSSRRPAVEDRTQRPPSRKRPAALKPESSQGPDMMALFSSLAPSIIGSLSGNSQNGQMAAALLPMLAPVLGNILGSGGSSAPSAAQASAPKPGTHNSGSGSFDIGSLLSLAAPLLGSAFGGGSQRPQHLPPKRKHHRRPPLPPPTTQPPPTTTTASPDHRPECAGTCIASYISFTCFGNAAMTEIFKCDKKATKCCSSKTAIDEHNNNLIRRQTSQRRRHKYPPRQDHQSVWQRPLDSSEESDYDTAYEDEDFPFATAASTNLEYPPQTVSRPRHPTSKFECGIKGSHRQERVVGGSDASPGEWCWHVALINSQNQYLCGGALIGDKWVVTAAHCITNIVRAGDTIYVRVGDHDLTQKYGSSGAQTHRVATSYIHHNHNSQTLDNDIAILKLSSEVDLKDGVCLICLPSRHSNQFQGKKCAVTGYGYMGESGPIPLKIRSALVPTVNDNECVRKINAVTEKIFILPASSFCAGGEVGHDACQGDGGGPLACRENGYYELTGLVSWGFGCGRQDVPGVYVKVSSFIGWINQIINVNNS